MVVVANIKSREEIEMNWIVSHLSDQKAGSAKDSQIAELFAGHDVWHSSDLSLSLSLVVRLSPLFVSNPDQKFNTE